MSVFLILKKLSDNTDIVQDASDIATVHELPAGGAAIARKSGGGFEVAQSVNDITAALKKFYCYVIPV